ncbi:DUF4834 family protein [Fulvivirga lutea]|uniref:DUF4834 domain-containing protein n=1 Tax=Fulvivirga lutea TaxID=2810512 RepID=A0A974WHH2_9BACT|nr:DUF4834 family protein [Fulvivirga lutea]QSE98623.1 DUF4834 domain-containing protein [Fulvivirga lutea]
MIKFLLIIFILGYIFFKGLGFFIRMILGGSSMNQFGNQQQSSSQKPKNGNVNVDYIPKDQKPKKENFKGGEYVDFEEVK